MPTVYLFKDKDGDLLFSQKRELEVGTTVMCVYADGVNMLGGPEAFLRDMPTMALIQGISEVHTTGGLDTDFTFVREFESDSQFARFTD